MRAGIVALSVVHAACGGGNDPNGTDGGADAAAPTLDAPFAADVSTARDAGTDAPAADGSTLDGGTDDAGDAGVCDCPPPTSTCLAAECVDGACVDMAIADGTVCDELGMTICVGGACVMRGCGDGYREPGASVMREGCDDGNLTSGDACSIACEPAELAVFQHSDDGMLTTITERGPAVGVDGAGNVLLVWWDESYGSIDMTPTDVAARRYTASGVAMPVAGTDPIILDAGYPVGATDPRVAGLAGGGWAVVWARGRQVWTRVVHADGTLGVMRQVSTGPLVESDPAVAALADGYIVVWVSLASPSFATDPYGGVRARLYTEAGGVRGAEFVVPTDRSTRETLPMVAADGDTWMVVWNQSPTTGLRSVRARRFDGATPLDATELTITSEESTLGNVASMGSGSFVVAWQNSPDLYARVIAPGAIPSGTGDILLVASGPDVGQPIPAPLRSGSSDFLVLYDEGFVNGYDFATSPGVILPMDETAAVRALLAVGDVRFNGASAVAAPNGVWFVWGRDNAGTPMARAFLLPFD